MRAIPFAHENADGTGFVVLTVENEEEENIVVHYTLNDNAIDIVAVRPIGRVVPVAVVGESNCPGWCSLVGTCDESTGTCTCPSLLSRDQTRGQTQNAMCAFDCGSAAGPCGAGVCVNNDATCTCQAGHQRKTAPSSTVSFLLSLTLKMSDFFYSRNRRRQPTLTFGSKYTCERVKPTRERASELSAVMRSADGVYELSIFRAKTAERLTLRKNGEIIQDDLFAFNIARRYVVSSGQCRQASLTGVSPPSSIVSDVYLTTFEFDNFDASHQCEVWRAGSMLEACVFEFVDTSTFFGGPTILGRLSASLPSGDAFALSLDYDSLALQVADNSVFSASNVADDCSPSSPSVDADFSLYLPAYVTTIPTAAPTPLPPGATNPPPTPLPWQPGPTSPSNSRATQPTETTTNAVTGQSFPEPVFVTASALILSVDVTLIVLMFGCAFFVQF